MDKNPYEKKSKGLLIAIIFCLLVIIGFFVYFTWPFLSQFNNPDQVKEWIMKAGKWGPLVFIVLQVAQIIIAPIPGHLIAFIGGYLFGPLLGLLYTMIGAAIGLTTIFVLTKKLGRPFVEKFISDKTIKKFDNFVKSDRSIMALFLIFLLPIFPDDILAFVAGLSPIKTRTLVFISLVARSPSYIVMALAGDGMTNDIKSLIIFTGILVFLSLIVWRKRSFINEFVASQGRLNYIRVHWRELRLSFFLAGLGLAALLILLITMSIAS